jgi:iron complex outermembrane receptor protein
MSMSFGFTYAFSKQFSLKANIARGYRSPSITELASNGLDPGAHIVYLGNRDFVPEFSFQQDIGLIFQTEAFQFSASVFNNQLSNYIYLTQKVDLSGNAITDAQGNRTFQYQQSAAKLYGIESDMLLHPANWQQFSISSMIALTYGINQKEAFAGKGNEGENMPFIPPLKWTGVIAKVFNTGNAFIPNISIQAEWEYAGLQNKFLALYDTETATAAYTLFNLGAGTKLELAKNKSLSFQFQVNNLFDLAYQNNLSRLKYFEYYQSSPNAKMGIYNMGRNAALKCIFSF